MLKSDSTCKNTLESIVKSSVPKLCNNPIAIVSSNAYRIYFLVSDYDFPTYCGKALKHNEFDATFFNVPFNFPPCMDPVGKKCLEMSAEAIIDAGSNLKFNYHGYIVSILNIQ